MFDPALIHKAGALISDFRTKGLRIATAESCTGGLIAAILTEIAGSSDVFERGFITYSNASKSALLGVDKKLIATDGAVSEAVAGAMALGALERAGVDVAVAITGVAGPGGATPYKPVGLVYIAVARKNSGLEVSENRFTGNRSEIRLQAVEKVVEMLQN
jgi:nicotinamide-nucleotide amidase